MDMEGTTTVVMTSEIYVEWLDELYEMRCSLLRYWQFMSKKRIAKFVKQAIKAAIMKVIIGIWRMQQRIFSRFE